MSARPAWPYVALAGAAILLVAFEVDTARSQTTPSVRAAHTNADRLQPRNAIDPEPAPPTAAALAAPTEAPTGFDNQTNGFTEQGPPF